MLGNQPVPIRFGSTPRHTLVELASMSELETRQPEPEPNGPSYTGALASISSTSFVVAYTPELTRLEPLAELLL